MALDDFSHFQSASEWRDFPPPTEYVTGELKPLHSFLPALFDKFALRMTIADVCESPIEVDLGVMFLIAFRAIGDDDFQLVPQQVLRSFRYDFAVTHQGKLIGLIECDGKEFHSTTEQIANDHAKDKLAAQMGVRMFRFSGSDIWRDPQGCVREVLYTIIPKIHLTPDQWDALNLALAPRPTAPDEFLCAAAA
jgi:very-short-patch-repair endonuclease